STLNSINLYWGLYETRIDGTSIHRPPGIQSAGVFSRLLADGRAGIEPVICELAAARRRDSSTCAGRARGGRTRRIGLGDRRSGGDGGSAISQYAALAAADQGPSSQRPHICSSSGPGWHLFSFVGLSGGNRNCAQSALLQTAVP